VASGGTDGGGEDACAAPAPVNTGDGHSACGTATCAADTYCFDSFQSECLQGCTAAPNCANGEYCDLSNATKDAMGKQAGTCRAPPSCTPPPPSQEAGACPDVHGVYSMSVDTAGSSPQCAQAVSNTKCTVTQTACSLAWSCTPDNGFMTSTVDSSGKSSLSVPAPGGGTASCVVMFASGALTWDCQFTGQGTAIDCKGAGTM